jgi:ketosteroid isomerase-like protein
VAPAGAWGVAMFALMLMLFGTGAVLIFINFLALRQAVTPEPLLGRMTSTMRWLILLPAGPGALLGGWLGEHVGLRAALAFAGLMAADRLADLERVVASERAFAARAQVVNARQAFAEFFAPDAVLFAPFAAPAFPGLNEGPEWGINIQWRPVAAVISGAGDLGYTTGPSEFRRPPAPAPVRFGHYTSVWQRQPDGRYLVRIDIGIDHPAPLVRTADWSAPETAPVPAPVVLPAQRREALVAMRALDAATGKAAEKGAPAAFSRVLADDARLHRGGHVPAVGRAAALAALAADEEISFGWTPEDAVVAESADFGFVYGRGRWARGTVDSGELAYLNIWQWRGGEWRLIVHTSNPIQPRLPQ